MKNIKELRKQLNDITKEIFEVQRLEAIKVADQHWPSTIEVFGETYPRKDGDERAATYQNDYYFQIRLGNLKYNPVTITWDYGEGVIQGDGDTLDEAQADFRKNIQSFMEPFLEMYNRVVGSK